MTIDEVYQTIDKINWSEFETAYGNASGTEPVIKFTLSDKIKHYNEYRFYKFKRRKNKYIVNCPQKLKELFSGNEKTEINAAFDLSNALCHQRVMISNAALPAYEILIYKLKTAKYPGVLEELTEMFYGFAVCTENNQNNLEWCDEIRKKLKRDKNIFHGLIDNSNEIVSYFANSIIEQLER